VPLLLGVLPQRLVLGVMPLLQMLVPLLSLLVVELFPLLPLVLVPLLLKLLLCELQHSRGCLRVLSVS
jgi:hypothetical protein